LTCVPPPPYPLRQRAALRDEADNLRGEIEGLRDELHEARGAAGGEQEGDAEALRARLAQVRVGMETM